MKKLSIFTFLALFAATLTHQGSAWAQDPEDTKADNWGQVPTVTSKWTHITEGSTTGFELKDANYYVTEDLIFTNTISGPGQGSGMYVQAGRTVTLYIPAGVTLTAIGANAYETTGAGAGILLPEGSTLNIVGAGKLVAKGGNAANGAAGKKGGPAYVDGDSWEAFFLGDQNYPGVGGWGGHGGGGAGAGIGTAGGNGGAGGTQIADNDENRPHGGDDEDVPGVPGNPGADGTTATAMGTINFQSTITTDISGGAAGIGGASGMPGNGDSHGGDLVIEDIEIEYVMGIPIPVPKMDITNMVAAAGGGGGGGGAGGGSAEAIGTGGAGGGGGGSGACGNVVTHDSWLNDDHGTAGAGGGKGGVGVNGNNGKNGYYVYLEGTESLFDDTDDIKDGGAGGNAGSASVDMSSTNQGVASALKYKVSYYTVGATLSKNEEEYEVGNGSQITLPTIESTDGKNYKWILSIYGNTIGTTSSHCGGPNGYVYEPGTTTVDLSNIYGDIEFCAVYIGCTIDCASETEQWWNTTWAYLAGGKYAVVNLKNRKLYKDGYWNTLTLPFSLSAEKLATTCLAGADIRKFENAAWNGTDRVLTLDFSSSLGAIEAGVPYIIRWGTPETATGEVIEDPYFTNVEVTLTDQSVLGDDDPYNNYETESNDVRFQAVLGPTQLQANDNMFVLGAKNKIYKVTKQMWVLATRAYLDCYSNSDISMARELVMDFGEGEQTTTYIDNITVEDNRESQVEGIFNLNGQRLDAPQKGINIINGKKVVIK